MTDKQTPPDWVLIEAAKRSCWRDHSAEELRDIYRYAFSASYDAFRTLCDMIERYEQPPVDRKLLCVEEAMRQWGEVMEGSRWLARRAIELYEEGFGK